MFVVVLTYVKPLDVIDAALDGHVRFLETQFAAGVFVASGRRVPRTGGLILASGCDRAALDAILTEDPFQREGLARYEVIEFVPSKMRAGFEAFVSAAVVLLSAAAILSAGTAHGADIRSASPSIATHHRLVSQTQRSPGDLSASGASFPARSRGFEGGEASPVSPVIDGNHANTQLLALPITHPERPSSATGVTLSQVDTHSPSSPALPGINTSIAAALSEALSAWLREPDIRNLRQRLIDVLDRLEISAVTPEADPD